MPTVAVMLTGRAAQALAAEQIGTLATVRFCESIGALLETVAKGDVDAVVADLRDVSGQSILPAFGALRHQAPHLPLILHCLPTPEALRELPDTSAFRRGLSLVFATPSTSARRCARCSCGQVRRVLRRRLPGTSCHWFRGHSAPSSWSVRSRLHPASGSARRPPGAERLGELSSGRFSAPSCPAPGASWAPARRSTPPGGSTCRGGRPSRWSPKCGSPMPVGSPVCSSVISAAP